jgi:putative ABC transport system permease protein
MPNWSTFCVDTKLGLRMLRKHWALTLIGGVAMTAAMTLGASMFNFVQAIAGTELPLPEGDRVVILQPWNETSRRGQQASMDDFERWRRELQSVVDTGAFRRSERNLTTDGGPAGPVTVAEMSAAGFRVARVAPRLGRFLSDDDERAGAPPVVVIGYNVWRSRFASDPQVIGRRVQLNGTFHTIVGVMPEGFAFPVRDQLWTPLQATEREEVTVFARLAPEAALERARAEVEALGLLPAAAMEATPNRLKPRAVPYVTGISGERNLALVRLVPLLFALLLIPPCINIAVLIYARTVARQGEFAARAALGASRSRIVAQVFIEVLLLTGAAAGASLLFASGVSQILSYAVVGNRPFWMDFRLSYGTIVFATALALLAALIAGAIPALRATRRWQLAGGLHALNRGYAPRLGKVWTAVVVLQVALSVAVMPTSIAFAWDRLRPGILGPGFEADEFLLAELRMDAGEAPAAAAARFSVLRAEVVRQLRAEPGITAVTLFELEPFAERSVRVEVDSAAPGESESVAFNQVDPAFFDTFGLPLLAGRGFEPGDPERNAIVVNRSFVKEVLADANPLGRAVRVGERNGTTTATYEIVGLVGDQFAQSNLATMYRPLASVAPATDPGGELSIRLAMHTASPLPSNLANRLREIVAALDPTLRVDDIQTLGEIYWYLSVGEYVEGSALAGLALGILMFSVAGIYTLMAFTVVQRRREIGVRSALGASPLWLVLGIFRRVLVPVSAGVALGGVTALLLNFYLSPLLFGRESDQPLPWILPAAEAFILLVGVLAVLGPTRRALGVDPVEILREG